MKRILFLLSAVAIAGSLRADDVWVLQGNAQASQEGGNVLLYLYTSDVLLYNPNESPARIRVIEVSNGPLMMTDRELILDPAHSTSDIFETPFGAEEREIYPGLHGLEIDASLEARRYIDNAKAGIARMFSHAVAKEAERQIELASAMPGVEEVALFDRISDLIIDRFDEYDLLVFDTAPTGHTLRLLRMPELVSTWIAALSKRRRALLSLNQDIDQVRLAPASAGQSTWETCRASRSSGWPRRRARATRFRSSPAGCSRRRRWSRTTGSRTRRP